MKKTIYIDLDGVLNNYTGNFDINYIPQIKDGAKEFLQKLSENFIIKLYTTRNKILASKWLIDNNLDSLIDDVTSEKGLCFLYIDDRCLNFNGDYAKMLNDINNFKPWYR
ncbi:hypothetical protein IJG72_07605 [bacterium]|nr:hypothetical protein [bacterium]